MSAVFLKWCIPSTTAKDRQSITKFVNYQLCNLSCCFCIVFTLAALKAQVTDAGRELLSCSICFLPCSFDFLSCNKPFTRTCYRWNDRIKPGPRTDMAFELASNQTALYASILFVITSGLETMHTLNHWGRLVHNDVDFYRFVAIFQMIVFYFLPILREKISFCLILHW